MYICVCNAITDREIRQCVELGARSLEELQEALGAATCCGRCTQAVEEILQECTRCGCAAFAPASS
jgi:bacterioferritin-associated ferredoxin